MTLRLRLEAVAEWLRREAQHRQNRAKRTIAGLDFVQQADNIFTYPRRPSDLPEEGRGGERFAWVSVYPRKGWVLLTLIGERHAVADTPRRVEIPVIIYFRYYPKLDVTGEDEKQKRDKRREMRAILRRARAEGNLTSHSMFVDSRMSTHHITGILAIFLAQEGISDSSTEELLGLCSHDPVTVRVGSELVRSFIDPAHPGSYPAFRKALRLRVAGPEGARTVQAAADDATLFEYQYEQMLSDEDRKKVRRPRGRANQTQDDFNVRHAAKILGVPWRTLYHRIQNKKLSVERDRRERIRVPAAELERQMRKENERKARSGLARFLAERSQIRIASARRSISRALKRGKSIEQIFTEAKGIRRED